MARRSFPIFCLFAATTSLAEIHKCEDEYGNVAYQQTPCPKIEEAEDLEPTPTAESLPTALPAQEMTLPTAETMPRTVEDVEACKDPLRDAIDVIEAEMLRGYSADQGEEFKQELRGLTEQMRACE